MLLAAPRDWSEEQREHLAHCDECARLMSDLTELERGMQDATAVAVPDALADRILLARRPRHTSHYAAAALVLLTAGFGSYFGATIFDDVPLRPPIHAVTPTHPAVAAISLVAEERFDLPHSGDKAEMHEELERLGLAVKHDATAFYAGRCRMNGMDCEMILVSKADLYGRVLLIPDFPGAKRMLVSDRQLIALVHPARNGAYIVVADSADTARRIEKLLVRS